MTNNSYVFPDLKSKIVLVTGASRGIGREIAKTLATNGVHVAINFLPGELGAQELSNELESLGGKGTPIYFDITKIDEMKNAIDEFQKNNGVITGLVNNAGISIDQLALRLKEESLDKTLDVNLKGAIMLTSHLTKTFLKAENVSIVNISSVVGLMGNASQIAYASSKAGMIGFTKSYAKEMSAKNVRCNAICPGFIETAMTDALNDQVKETYLSNIPLKRFGKAYEVSNLVCFLLSQASAYITGETIKIDGGLYI